MENKQCKSCKLYNSLGCPYSGCDWEENEECDEFIKEEEMNNEKELKTLNAEWLVKAVETIESGLCNKLEKDNITVYRCGRIIRIDIKEK